MLQQHVGQLEGKRGHNQNIASVGFLLSYTHTPPPIHQNIASVGFLLSYTTIYTPLAQPTHHPIPASSDPSAATCSSPSCVLSHMVETKPATSSLGRPDSRMLTARDACVSLFVCVCKSV